MSTSVGLTRARTSRSMICWRSPRNDVTVEPGRPIISSITSARSLLPNSTARSSYLLDADVRPADRVEGGGVQRLQRQRARGQHPALRHDLDDLPEVLDGVLGVAGLPGLGVAVLALQLDDLAGDLDVAGEDPEVGVGAEDHLDLVLGAPLELGEDPVEVELADPRQRGRAPVAEGAAVGAAPVGLDRHEADLGVAGLVEQTREVRRRQDVEVGDAIPLGVLDDLVAQAEGDAGQVAEHRQVGRRRRRSSPGGCRAARRRSPRPRRAR